MVTLANVVTQLGFVLAVDNCSRGCRYCPASEVRALPQRAPLYQLARTLSDLATCYARLGTPPPRWAVPCWRFSDPLDYLVRTRSGRVGTCTDLARLWHDHLHQGLYLMTNGSEGRPQARRALHQLAASPELISQVKLTIGPADRDWGTSRYEHDLAADIAILAPLWQLPSTRTEDPRGRRLRINLRTTPTQQGATLETVARILTLARLPTATIQRVLDDVTMLTVKPLNTAASSVPQRPSTGELASGSSPSQPGVHTGPRTRFGIRPDRSLFLCDVNTITEHDLTDPAGLPARWPLGQAAFVDLNAPIATSPAQLGTPELAMADPHPARTP